MNVSELSDVELNRAMIWCYGDRHPSFDLVNVEDFRGEIFMEIGDGHEYSPDYLSDYNLTMLLAVEHKIAVLPCMTGRHLATRYAGTENVEAANKNPLRAIAEVLIMIAMEKKG